MKRWPSFLPCPLFAIHKKPSQGRWGGWLLFFFLGVAAPMLATGSGPDLPKIVEQNVKEAGRVLDICERQAKTEQFVELQGTLRQYSSLLEKTSGSVREYLATHRKTPRQFKNAEIHLRKQLKRLQDLRPNLPVLLRENLDAAADRANELRNSLFGELFDLTTAPKEKPKEP